MTEAERLEIVRRFHGGASFRTIARMLRIDRKTVAAVIRTYGWIARQLGQPRAAKDVGAALGQNPIPYLIPCHRVVYSDGRLGGYIFGQPAKRALLLAEGVELAASDDAKVSARALAASTPESHPAQLALTA